MEIKTKANINDTVLTTYHEKIVQANVVTIEISINNIQSIDIEYYLEYNINGSSSRFSRDENNIFISKDDLKNYIDKVL